MTETTDDGWPGPLRENWVPPAAQPATLEPEPTPAPSAEPAASAEPAPSAEPASSPYAAAPPEPAAAPEPADPFAPPAPVAPAVSTEPPAPPRPSPSPLPVGHDPMWNPTADPLGSTDLSGRHAVPADTHPDSQPSTSYGTFIDNPPYVRDEDVIGGLNTAVTVPDLAPPVEPTREPAARDLPPQYGVPWSTALEPERPAAPVPDQPRDTVTCPECGATQQVQLTRREAADFCRRCDFPLFWVPSRVTRDLDMSGASLSLRRLPGTQGRSSLAYATCPHCSELNSVAAEICVRCGLSMHPVVVAAPPPPAPLPPEPEPEPIIDPGVALWVWLLLALGVVAVLSLIVLGTTGTIG